MQVTGDINKLFRDLGDESNNEQVKRVELGSYSKKRGVIEKATVSLDVLSKIFNDGDIDKTLQDSPWGNKVLTDAQKYYAATDAIIGLKVYNTLSKMPDFVSAIGRTYSSRRLASGYASKDGQQDVPSLKHRRGHCNKHNGELDHAHRSLARYHDQLQYMCAH
jgi:hypothetical protein